MTAPEYVKLKKPPFIFSNYLINLELDLILKKGGDQIPLSALYMSEESFVSYDGLKSKNNSRMICPKNTTLPKRSPTWV